MSDNWVVQNLENALEVWNEKLAEIWTLITQSPQAFKGGSIWSVIVSVHGALQAIGYALLASYATAMTTWAVPMSKLSAFGSNADAVTSSTPLAMMKNGDFATLTSTYSVVDMFLGRVGGSLGEVSALMLLLGGVYLVIRKVISWHIPVAYIATVAILTLIAAPAGISGVDYMLYNVFGGGLMLGAIFMATDYATSPVTKPGQIIFGIGCGLLTCFIRRFGSYPEGVCYSILIMNCTTWLLDKYIRPTIYGAPKKEKKEAAAK